MRFAAKKLDLPILTILFTPTVKSWLGQRTWIETPAKEALPLPLRACLELEQALGRLVVDFLFSSYALGGSQVERCPAP